VPGGAPGLQNQWGGAILRLVGSIPTRSRHSYQVNTENCQNPLDYSHDKKTRRFSRVFVH